MSKTSFAIIAGALSIALGVLTPSGVTAQESVVIAPNGNVGIGTSSPGTKLHLFDNAADVFTILTVQNTGSGVNSVGTFRAQSNTAFMQLQAHGSGRTLSRFGQPLASWVELIQSTGNGLIIGTGADKPLILGTNNTNRLQIDGSTGNIGIGTASPSNSLHVKRTDGTAHLLIEEASSTAAWRTITTFKNSGGVQLNMQDTSAFGGTGFTWSLQNVNAQARISDVGDATTELMLDQSGNLTVAGTVTQGSSRTIKERFSPVDSRDVLRRVLDLPITTWSYQETPGVRHVGPMSEDFFAAFAVGSDDKGISVTDSAGVALAAIQGLSRQVSEVTTQKDEEIAQLRHENADLAQRLAAIEALVLQDRRAEGVEAALKPAP